tara:strand:- start:1027 stop:1413 length:387 start_codon:yes stop_codon:yes gene_type:complete
MEILNNNSVYSKLTKRKRSRRIKSDLRLFCEGIIMIFIGSNLILFLNSIPDKFIWNEFANEAMSNLINGVFQLIDALIKIGTATSVGFLIFFSLFLIIAGSIRLLRVFSKSRLFHIRKNRDNNFFNTK